jgi:hypothetical protein
VAVQRLEYAGEAPRTECPLQVRRDKPAWRRLARKEGFLVPVKALSVIFRAKFRDALGRKVLELFASVPNGVWSEGWFILMRALSESMIVSEAVRPAGRESDVQETPGEVRSLWN